MHKVWAVIRREFIERVRSRWFLISTVLGPLFMIAVTVLPSLLIMKGGRPQRMAVIDAGAGTLVGRINTQLARSARFKITVVPATEERLTAIQDSLQDEVKAEKLDGYLTLTSSTTESGEAEYRGRNVSSLQSIAMLENAMRQSIIVERLTRRGVDPAVVQEAQGHIDLKTSRVSSRGGGESGQATFFLGYGVGLVLYMVILLYGINVMRSVLEEKNTRIVEILVSSLKPFELMMGKVVGVGGVGLFQFGIWIGTSWLVMHNRAKIFALLHIAPAASATDAFQMPHISGQLLGIVLAYFLLGYLLYSSLFAVVGSTCTSETEAQQAQQPVMMLLVFSLIISFSAMSDPGGPIATTGSMFPLSAAIIMPVRVATSDVAPTQIAASLAIMAATCLFVVWGAARIYRIGILMYGKRPSVKELLRWARQS